MTAETQVRNPDAPVITVDGPSGSGKGTICIELAKHLGWHLLDSGALYRLVGLSAQNAGIDAENKLNFTKIADLARNLDVQFEVGGQGEIDIWLEGVQVNDAIRTETAGNQASKVAAIPAVREALLERQRDFQRAPGLVADGRDMGTVVFPTARTKIYLTASAEERAKRRYKQLKQKGINVNLAALSREIEERDERDASRAVAPLKPAGDAKILDTTGLSIEQVVEAVLTHIDHNA